MKEILLKVENLSKEFVINKPLFSRSKGAGTRVHAVTDVSFSIMKGETLGLVGESGSGKSTLGRTILHLTPPTAGSVELEGRVMSGHKDDLSFLRQKGQIIFQNPYSSLNPRKTVRQILSVPLRHRGVRERGSLHAMVDELLLKVGLHPRHADQYPHQFSGGQRQRIGIARAVAMLPSFIVADEPVSALDVSIQAQVLNLMKDLQEEFRLTYLFVSHDLNVVRFLSDRIAVMYLGRIVELAVTEELFTASLHPYTEALLSNSPSFTHTRERIILEGSVPSPMHLPTGCPFHTRCHRLKGPECKSMVPPLQEVAPNHFVSCHHYVSEDGR